MKPNIIKPLPKKYRGMDFKDLLSTMLQKKYDPRADYKGKNTKKSKQGK